LSELFPPVTQHGLIDVQASASLALRLYDQMDMGMLLVGMKRHGVAMLQSEVLAREGPGSLENLVGRSRPRHREHDIVDELHFPGTGGAVFRLAVLAGRELQMPTLE
jgi:hypothetical protein